MTELSDFGQYRSCSVEMPRFFLIFTVLLAGGSGAPTLSATEGFAFFESQVRPLLVKYCYECHYAHGETDEFGYFAVKDKVHMHDLHATMLHLLGLDHLKLTYRYAGRDFRLTDVYGEVVKGILG
jgi:hypothetical protein